MKRRLALRAVLALSAALLAWPVSAAPMVDPAADIDAFIRKAMVAVGVVPGLSIAVVQGDEPMLVAGYGVADIRTQAPVDGRTKFYIASATKSFTALAISRLAARGAMDLNEPVARWMGPVPLPADIAASVSLEDLLSHRSGLDNYPMAFRAAYSGDHTPAIMTGLLAATSLDPESPPGSFRYTNVGYNLATTLLEARFDLTWQDMVQAEVLIPAGMTDTTPFVTAAEHGGVLAVGHLADFAEPRVSPLQKVDATMQSAGGLISTAEDMARWLELQINDGVLNGERIFPEGLIASTHISRVAQDKVFGAYQRDGYGLGWQIGRFGDDILLHHFGNFSGSRAHVSFMPDRRIGVVVLLNEDVIAGELADVVANYVYDRLAGRADLEAVYEVEVAGLIDRRDRRQAGVAKARADRAARPWLLTRPMESYVGAYESPTMGVLHIGLSGDSLTVSIGGLSGLAEPYTDPDTIRVELVPFQGETLSFEGTDGLVFGGETFRRMAAATGT